MKYKSFWGQFEQARVCGVKLSLPWMRSRPSHRRRSRCPKSGAPGDKVHLPPFGASVHYWRSCRKANMTLLTLLETSYLPRTEAYTHTSWKDVSNTESHKWDQSSPSGPKSTECTVTRTEIAESNHEFLGLFAYLKWIGVQGRTSTFLYPQNELSHNCCLVQQARLYDDARLDYYNLGKCGYLS